MNNKQTTKCTGKGIRITLCRSSDDSLRTFTEHEIENGKVQEWSGQCDVFIAEQYNQANNYEKQTNN